MAKAFRPTTRTPCQSEIVLGHKSSFREQRELELNVLHELALEMNRHGQHIPDEKLFYKLVDDVAMLDYSNSVGRFEAPWPDEEHYSILGLAQHFGLPTRLMDWSRDSRVAAYFAARQCVDEMKRGTKITSFSVFALNIKSNLLESPSEIRRRLGLGKSPSREPKTTYHVVEAPAYSNKNLQAQMGLFICCTEYGNIKNHPFKPISLDRYLMDRDEKPKSPGDSGVASLKEFSRRLNGTTLYKFSLPAALAPELLVALDRMHINPSKLFPGLDGCVQSLYARCTE